MDMEGDSKSTDALRDANLCVTMPITAVGVSEYQTATESMPSSSRGEVGVPSPSRSEPSSSNGVSVRIEGLMQVSSEYASAVEFEIEASKDHWSQLDNPVSDDEEENVETDLGVFEKWGSFFANWGDRLVVGEKIAEGGQAEIFNAELTGAGEVTLVLLVFKEGYRLRDLEKPSWYAPQATTLWRWLLHE